MNKQLLPLFLLALIVAGVAFFLVSKNLPQRTEKSHLFSSLRTQAGQINQIKLSNAGGTLFSAQQVSGQWSAEIGTDGVLYPADQEKLSELVNQLADVYLYEAKTSKSENYSRLGLMELNQPDSQATRIELIGADKHFRVLIGNTASSGMGSYARLPSEQQTWLLDKVIQLPLESQEWLKQPIFDFDIEQVMSVEMKGEQPWKIHKDQDSQGGYELLSIPQGRELKYASVLDSVLDNLSSLRFDDVLPLEYEGWQAATQIREVEVILGDSIINLQLAEVEDTFLLKAQMLTSDIPPYWQEVTYKISSFGFNQLNKTMEDFLAPVEQEQEPLPPVAIDEGDAPGK